MLQCCEGPVWCTHVRTEPGGGFKRCNNRKCPQPYSHIEPAARVGKSRVHGQVLFARRPIKKGEVVCPYSGTCNHHLNAANSSLYILDVNWEHPFTGKKETWYLDSRQLDNAAGRYANDARNTSYFANARYTNSPLLTHPLAQHVRYVNIRSTKYIRKNEEILVPYGTVFWA